MAPTFPPPSQSVHLPSGQSEVPYIKAALDPVSVPPTDPYLPTLPSVSWSPPNQQPFPHAWQNPDQKFDTNLLEAVVTRTLTLVVPAEPEDDERTNNPIDKSMFNGLLQHMREFFKVSTTQYDKSIRHTVVKEVLTKKCPTHILHTQETSADSVLVRDNGGQERAAPLVLNHALMRELTNVFFTYCHPIQAVIHKPSFSASLCHNRVPSHLLFAICALAAPLSQQLHIRSMAPPRLSGKPFAHEPLSQMFDGSGHLICDPDLFTAGHFWCPSSAVAHLVAKSPLRPPPAARLPIPRRPLCIHCPPRLSRLAATCARSTHPSRHMCPVFGIQRVHTAPAPSSRAQSRPPRPVPPPPAPTLRTVSARWHTHPTPSPHRRVLQSSQSK
ncbi:hypothetical protein DFH08DRAFT_1049476 [Mycena albidolilacea]|uniref:Xylanolytic transcriptional activator regulatory domain-containing protein n=1 Tax=Mycena albidolilacea TaxID=1033008 RepID=A0AAD6Z704_9AGAR|nr:hypothetical protein DFH08DRAFT_1049476 [Mycena albidolilacea]